MLTSEIESGTRMLISLFGLIAAISNFKT